MTAAAGALDTTLAALATPRRRQMVELLARQPRRASELADALGALRPAVSRDLRALRAGGLIRESPAPDDGRARILSLEPAPLLALQEWTTRTTRFWEQQLDAFAAFSEREERRVGPASVASVAPPVGPAPTQGEVPGGPPALTEGGP